MDKTKNLDDVLRCSSEYVENMFGLEIVDSSFHVIDSSDWTRFCKDNRVDPESSGVYFTKPNLAFLKDDEFLPLTLIHELFGHGIFIEHSKYGERLQALEDEIASIKSLASSSSQSVSLYSKELKRLKDLLNNVEEMNEGFSLWMESILAKENGLEDLYEYKFNDIMRNEDKARLIDTSMLTGRSGRLALFGGFGLPLSYTHSELYELLDKMYVGIEDKSRLTLLQGSRDPYSDIDIYVVSDDISDYYNGWLDIMSISTDDFDTSIKNLDALVVDTIMSSSVISGCDDDLYALKDYLLKEPIKKSQIEYNQNLSKKYADISEQSEDAVERDKLQIMSLRYKRMASWLMRGDRLQDIPRDYPDSYTGGEGFVT